MSQLTKWDRMLRHLCILGSGKLQKAAGIVFGYSPTIFPSRGALPAPWGTGFALKIPILYGLAFWLLAPRSSPFPGFLGTAECPRGS